MPPPPPPPPVVAVRAVWFLALSAALWNVLSSVYLFQYFPVVILGCFVGLCVSDVVTGVVHWSFDTWGTLEIPVIGQSFIRSFREHHVDPFALTRHDFIQANADSSFLTTPMLAFLSRMTIADSADVFLHSYFISLLVLGTLTNQLHKYAHQLKPSPFVRFLQDLGIILSRRSHSKHHRPPFDCAYCITNGWFNPFLDRIQFWKRAEAFITAITGAIPRVDDAVWTNLVTFDESKTS